MSRKLKNFIYCCAIPLVVLVSLNLFAEMDTEKIETQLLRVEDKDKIPLLMELTGAYRIEQPNKALQYGKEALELLRRFPNPKFRVTILNDMSATHRILGNIQESLEYANSALKIARDNNDKSGIAASLFALGKIDMQAGNLDQAMEYLTESSKLFEELNEQANLALTFNTISGIYSEKCKYPETLEYLHKALKIYEKLNDRKGIGFIYCNIGLVYWEIKDYEKSLEYYFKSLEIDKELNNKSGMVFTLNNMSIVYRERHEYQKSLECLNSALALSKELGSKYLLAMVFNSLGYLHRELKNNTLALEYFNQALILKEELQNNVSVADISINIASVYQRTGRFNEALQYANKGLEIAIEQDMKGEVGDAYQVLSQTYESMGDHRKSLEYYKKYKEINDEIFTKETTDKIAALQKDFDMERKDKQVALLQKDQENKKNLLIFLGLFTLSLIVLAFVIYTRYRLKTRITLRLEKEIAERIQTEQKLRESEEKFRVLAEKSLVGIWIIQDHIIKYINPKAIKIFGYPQEEIIAKNPVELAIEEDRPFVTEHLLQRLAGTGNGLPYEFRGVTKEGEIINLESYGSLTLYQGKPAVLESVIDITRRKIAESELIKSRKMESVGILAGGIAHDFNNLLAVIVGNTSILKLRFGYKDPKMSTFLENVEKASAQAAELAQKFITFSEGGWLMRKKIKLPALLKDTGHFSPEIKNIPVDVSIPPDLNPIHGDERQLRQVIANILLNAYESTNENDRKITVRARNITLNPENQFSLKQGNYVHISIVDNGKGIPSELLDKIFDPYFSTKNTVSQKGLGMGLAICYSIIKKHEGLITLSSEVRKGTTVNIYLPVFGKI